MLLSESKQLNWIYDLNQLGRSDAFLDSSNEVFEQILRHIVEGFGANTGSLVLYQGEDSNRLSIVAGIGLPEGCIGSVIPEGTGVIGWVLANKQALLLKGNINNDPRFHATVPKADTQIALTALCWPLLVGKRLIGVLCVNSFDDKANYTEADLDHGQMLVNLVTLVIDNSRLHSEQQKRIQQLAAANERYISSNRQLQEAHKQLVQSEKLSSIGQLAAGVAHEINNPIAYINSNLTSLKNYVEELLSLVAIYEKIEPVWADAEQLSQIQGFKNKIDLDFLKTDVLDLLDESHEGAFRVKKIVQALKDFSHAGGDDDWQWADLHTCLESTLNIANNEIKYKANVIKEFGNIPQVWCLPHQLNQVFMNLLVNAAHAIENEGTITVRTGAENDHIWVEVSDTGKGIAPEHLNKIFDPFFTTKPVGKGTGLGLSVSYNIIKKHNGEIRLDSRVGKGTTFRIVLPIKNDN
jgi:two-component system NtrC family sensor kinase